jgi:hypothetical protein
MGRGVFEGQTILCKLKKRFKIKGTKNMRILIVLFLILVPVLSFLFYWFEWRPSKIRAECDAIAWDKTVGYEDYDWKYEQCLHNKGLR